MKAGDKVVVVRQSRRFEKSTPKPETGTITRVGCKYGYVQFGGYETAVRFRLDNGESSDPRDGNARSNGLGFDVYSSESEWKEGKRQRDALKNLSHRIHRHGALERLSAAAVDRINAIMDEEL